MGILGWMKRRGREPEDEPARNPHETNSGKPIKQLWVSHWHSDDHGLQEFRYHVGRSEDGFHGGLEVSNRGGDGPFTWSRAVTTFGEAEKVSYAMRDDQCHQQDRKHDTPNTNAWER